jgi:anti-anti-sigma factor
MPFTLSHPSIVMPLAKTGLKLSMTGLVMGSMVPDFEFLLQMAESKNISNTWYGIFLFSIPATILFSFLFHNYVRNSLINSLPDFYKSRFVQFSSFNWNNYFKKNIAVVFISILIGIASHIAWDSFTHYNGYMVELIPWLSKNVVVVNFETPIYEVLQVVFSIIGLIMVHLQIMSIPKNHSADQNKFDFKYWMIFSISFLLFISIRLIFFPPLNSVSELIIVMMGGSIYSLFPVSIIFNKSNKNKMKVETMSITTKPFRILDHDQDCLMIHADKDLNSSVALDLRETVDSCLESDCSTIYLNAMDTENVDLSGINEIINSNYNVKQTSKKLVFVYKKDSKVEKWVDATGLTKFIDTAIIK